MDIDLNRRIEEWILSQPVSFDAAKRLSVAFWIDMPDGTSMPVLEPIVPLWIAREMIGFLGTYGETPRFILRSTLRTLPVTSLASQVAQAMQALRR